MSKQSVYAIATSEGQALQIVGILKDGGFSADDISVLFPDKDSTHEFSHEANTKAPEGAAVGAATGGILGGGIGLLAGIGSLAIPGVGPLIAAGPLLAALSGAAAGATAGGIAGSLIGLGIPEYEAKRYENRLAEGNILISVFTETGEEADLAEDLLKQSGAEDISTTSISDAKPVGRS